MRHTEIAIVGGGLAGSLAAAMLGRAGHGVVLVDPHKAYPPDFRCEKLDGVQVRLLEKTGLAEPVLRAATHDQSVWIARFGRLVEQRPSDQYGILYHTLVNTIRAEIPATVDFILGKVTAIATSEDRQQVTLSDGSHISARLVVLANGLNSGLRHALGMRREELSQAHSISVGFDVVPVGRPAFEFRAMTYYGERVSQRTAYITLFPIGATMRANLFVYRDIRDPWLSQLRHAPRDTLLKLLPRLHRLTGDFEVCGPVQIRPVDLYATDGYRRPGIVLVGDAFGTSCPAGGTGARKVLTDVERLCNVHIPNWLADPGMGEEKIATFYADPVKRACDAFSLGKAYSVRSLATDPSLYWQAQRWGRFLVRAGNGALRALHARLAGRASHAGPAALDPGLGRSA